MASMDKIKEFAKIEQEKNNLRVFKKWCDDYSKMRSYEVKDVIVPKHIRVDEAIKYFDSRSIPAYKVTENVISIAGSYTALLEHEQRR